MKRNKRYSTDEIIEIFQNKHSSRYDYSLVNYINKFTKVKIICKTHGEFEQTPHNHTLGQGCAKCAKKFMDSSFFIEKANLIHNNLYDYSQTKFKKAKEPVIIICKIHGEFKQTPDSHIQGSGCFKCFGSNKKTTQQFISDCLKIHGNTYDYSSSHYNGCSKKIQIICKTHGIFKQKASHHLRGAGCPVCSISQGERLIKSFLDNQNIVYEQQKKFDGCKYKKKLSFDFFIPSKNTCIEFDGLQHSIPIKHFGGIKGLVTRQKRDQIKNEFCVNNNLKLFRINYKNLDQINTLLLSFFRD